MVLINELRNIINDIIICLSASNTLYNSLNYASANVEYPRLKSELKSFIKAYEFYGYSIKKSSGVLSDKFESYEMTLFLNSLIQSEKEGNILENLEKLNDVMDLSYMKYTKREIGRKLLYVTFGTIAALVNIIAIVTYPIFMQVADNLQTIFN